MSKMVLIEAHPLLRLGLQHVLSKIEGNWQIVGLDMQDLAEVAQHNTQAELLVFGLPIETPLGWQALQDVRRLLMPHRILLLVDATPIQALSRLPEGCVQGCLMKRASIEALEAAIRLIMAGGQCFPSSHCAPPETIALTVQPASDFKPSTLLPLGKFDQPAENAVSVATGAQLLNITPRQYEVLVLLSRGYPIKTVSRMLNISIATAKTHACTLYQRLQVKNKGEAVYTALQRGATLNWGTTVQGNGTTYESNRL
ncbi:luxR family regulatory protein [Bordetella ansorpii]|uniref:LuxR family regulatory protein n=1 Tax=Bordetella ansorpii TaxID=288768 RepID=A0A157S5G1_9BORD|nr:response regulator transcription factor [Bordetella ansorpii]SAI65531.1 luxR family regulatory protein [Bordetella ansorpii]